MSMYGASKIHSTYTIILHWLFLSFVLVWAEEEKPTRALVFLYNTNDLQKWTLQVVNGIIRELLPYFTLLMTTSEKSYVVSYSLLSCLDEFYDLFYIKATFYNFGTPSRKHSHRLFTMMGSITPCVCKSAFSCGACQVGNSISRFFYHTDRTSIIFQRKIHTSLGVLSCNTQICQPYWITYILLQVLQVGVMISD